MNESHIMGWVAGGMQFGVAIYALRLNRRYGITRVGWSLFWAFTLLAVLQLAQSTWTGSAAIEVNVSYVLISFLLLIGMLHLETMLKERLRTEKLEQEMRVNLETEVKSKTEHLTRAIGELMMQMEETSRMAAIIESNETTLYTRTADGHAEAIGTQPPPPAPAHSFIDNDTQFLARILGGEWVAHL